MKDKETSGPLNKLWTSAVFAGKGGCPVCTDSWPFALVPTEVCLVLCGLLKVLGVHLFLKFAALAICSGCPDLALCGAVFFWGQISSGQPALSAHWTWY